MTGFFRKIRNGLLKIPSEKKRLIELDIRKLINENMARKWTWRGICPDCHGGTSKERSFDIRRDSSSYTYKCYRNSCGIWGRIPVRGTVFVADHVRPVASLNPYNGELTPLPKDVMNNLSGRWGMTYIDAIRVGRWQWAVQDRRIYMPIINIAGIEIGAQLRQLSAPSQKAKTETHKAADEPLLSWYTRRDSLLPDLTAYIVEDIPSAIKLSRHVPIAIALLGTEFTLPKVEKVLHATNKIALMLDQDATTKAFETRKNTSVFFDRFDVIPLNGPDIKDRTDEEIISLITQHDTRNRYSGRCDGQPGSVPDSATVD
jgi:hypothetical protein